jgi:hypothetical protein
VHYLVNVLVTFLCLLHIVGAEDSE